MIDRIKNQMIDHSIQEYEELMVSYIDGEVFIGMCYCKPEDLDRDGMEERHIQPTALSLNEAGELFSALLNFTELNATRVVVPLGTKGSITITNLENKVSIILCDKTQNFYGEVITSKQCRFLTELPMLLEEWCL